MFEIAVIPIFVNAGVAILPAVLGAAANVAALLLRPRDLARTVRRRPIAATVTVASLAALVAAGVLLWQVATAPAAQKVARAAEDDWQALAMSYLARQRVTSPSGPTSQTCAGVVVLGRDFARRSYDGGSVPLGLVGLWQHRVENGMFLSSPAVAGDRVYAACCQMDITGKFGGVFCLDAQTGRPKWENWKDNNDKDFRGFFSSPALTADGKRIVIGQGLHDDADCSLLCLDAATGKVLWQAPTPLHIEGSPAICGDVAVAGAGAIEGPDHKPTTHPGLVLAVRVSDGKELWRFQVNDPESSPAIGDDGTVYIGSGFNGSEVVALRGETDADLKAKGLDRVLWRRAVAYPSTGAITLTSDMVIAGGGNGDYVFAAPNPAGVVVALDRKTGEVRWERKLDDAVLGTLAADEAKVICPVRNGEVVAIGLKDGAVIWRQRLSGKSPVLAGAALAGKHIYAVSRDGMLAVMDAADGHVIEKLLLNDAAKPGDMGLSLSTPTVVGGRVYVGSETGGLRCLAGQRTAP